MRRTLTILTFLVGTICVSPASAQDPAKDRSAEKVGEQIGKALDRAGKTVREGIRETREALKEKFAAARESIDALSVEARVYSRLHWDKDFAETNFEITAEDDTVRLKGIVPDAAARSKALKIANETVGVTKVIDELSLKNPVGTPRPAETPVQPLPIRP